MLLYYIRPFLWLLVGKKGVCNLWPQRMAGKGDEEIRLVLLYYIRPVLWLLVGKKGVCNLWPQRMAGKGDEEIPACGIIILYQACLVAVGWEEGSV